MESMFNNLAKNQATPAPSPASPSAPSPAPSGSVDDIFNQMAKADQTKADADAKANASPRESGQLVNDVGNTVIVPKDGESFADTMTRAAAHGRTVSQQEINREVATMPGKAATVLAAAPVIGATGTAAGAAVNEVATALPSVIPHTIAGVKAVGEWAKANPIQAYLLYNVLKELIPGAKKAMGVIKGTPELE